MASSSETKKNLVDQVTPYKIGVLLLIDEYCRVLARMVNGQYQLTDIMSESQERELMICLLHLVQGADVDLVKLIKKIEHYLPPSVTKLVTDRHADKFCLDDIVNLWHSEMKLMKEEGVEALNDFFKKLPERIFCNSAILHKTSILGLFIRRMVLSFNKLTFSQVSQLHKQYTRFHNHWVQANLQQTSGFLDQSPVTYLDMLATCSVQLRPVDHDTSTVDTGKCSQRQAELFIAQQTFLLQHNQNKALSPKELQHRLSRLLINNPAMAEAHYLSYLNHLRLMEYCTALQNLHHYFDRQLVAPPPANAKNKPEEEVTLPRGFRYAALNLVALHFRFGHRAEALAALEEAIQLAQEASDHVCLQHALGWLQRLSIQGTGQSAYMLDRLVNKAGELNLAYLTSLGVQASAKHNALSTAHPASVFEFLLKSDIVNCQHSLSDLKCISYAQKASLWSLYGRREMCSLSSQGMLMLNTSDLGVYHSGDAECTALCHMANLHMEQGDYELAAEILRSAEERFPENTQHAHVWILCQQLQNFTKALHHGKHDAAQNAIANMAAIDELQAAYCRCLLWKEQGKTRDALDLCSSLLEKCQDQSGKAQENPQLEARLLLLQGELQCICGNASSASQPLLACLTMCRQHHYSYMVALATVHLALVQFYLDLPKQALMLIEEAYIVILSHGGLYDRGRVTYLWTRCHLAAAAKEGPDSKLKALLMAVQKMQDVLNCFRKVQAHRRIKDAVYFLARLYHELGFVAERNKCAHEFRELDQQFPTWKSTEVGCL